MLMNVDLKQKSEMVLIGVLFIYNIVGIQRVCCIDTSILFNMFTRAVVLCLMLVLSYFNNFLVILVGFTYILTCVKVVDDNRYLKELSKAKKGEVSKETKETKEN